jgi:hypothetical protein
MKTKITFLIMSFCVSLTCQGAIITVDMNGPADFNNIQAAINAANTGDTVVIAQGLYTGEGNRDIDFLGKAITVQSTDPNDPCAVANTVIDCNGTDAEPHRGFVFQSSEDTNSVLAGITVTNGYTEGSGGGIYCANSSPALISCIITENYAGWAGGGIFGSGGPITKCQIIANSVEAIGWEGGGGLSQCNEAISDCIISYNRAEGGDGGGLSKCNGPITRCVISYNWAWMNAGGLDYCDGAITDCLIVGNEAWDNIGGGLCDCNGPITNCIISDNVAYYAGAGLCLCSGAIKNCSITENTVWDDGSFGSGLVACHGTIDKCVISHNFANGSGGGLEYCNAIIANCKITGNIANEGPGGGLYDCNGTITNCVISGNISSSSNYWASGTGGGLAKFNGSITNCTIASNTSLSRISNYSPESDGGGISDCSGYIINCIIYGNTADVNAQIHSSSNPDYSCIQDWANGGTDNIIADPCFVAEGYWDNAGTQNYVWDDHWVAGDYHLKSQFGRWDPCDQRWVHDDVNSPCIDAGDPNMQWGSELWPHGKVINMGAYGGRIEASMSDSNLGLLADVDNSNIVDFTDYALLTGQWCMGQAGTIPRGRVTVDGDLSDWPDDCYWIALDKVYDDYEPCDINSAKFTLYWDDINDKVYAAVIVEDTEHIFTDEYISWNASDRIEVYSQGDCAGGGGFWHWENPEWDRAQQYMIGPDTQGSSWATWGTGGTLGPDVGLEYAVVVDGNRIIYEIGVKQFDHYGGITGAPTVVTNLTDFNDPCVPHVHMVKFDIVVSTRFSGGFGMLAENQMPQKYKNADSFQNYPLVETVPSPPYKPLIGDLDRNRAVDLRDFSELCDSWLQ